MIDTTKGSVLQKRRMRRLSNHVTIVAWSIFRYALLLGLSFVILYPLLYMLSMAFRPAEQIYDATYVPSFRHGVRRE